MFLVGNSGGPESRLMPSMAAIVQCVGWKGWSSSLICAYVWAKSKTVLCSFFPLDAILSYKIISGL